MERSALNTSPTLKLVRQHNIVTLRADWTKPNPEIEGALKRYDSVDKIPLTVIYRADSPDDPIILREVYTQDMLLEKLREAARSKGKGKTQTQASLN